MQLPTILLLALTTPYLATAAPQRDGERGRGGGSQERDVEMLYLFGLPGVSGTGNNANFVGRGTPGKCQNFPSFVKGFTQANPIDGFTCTLYLDYDCEGSAITVGPTNPWRAKGEPGERGGGEVPTLKSWKCNRLGRP